MVSSLTNSTEKFVVLKSQCVKCTAVCVCGQKDSMAIAARKKEQLSSFFNAINTRDVEIVRLFPLLICVYICSAICIELNCA